jgi:drug/metabolite transporter (DMT)-like permease
MSFLIILPGIIWGASFLFIAEALEALPPNGVTFLRIAIGFAVLSLFPQVRRPIQRSDRSGVFWLGVLWMAFPFSMFPFAEQHVSSATAGMLNGALPLFAVTVASALARRWPARSVLLGLAVGIAGGVLIAAPSMGQATDRRRGVLLILAALVSYGFAVNLARPLQQRNGALPVVWCALGWALLLTAPLGVPAVLHARWSPWPALSLLALGALGTGVALVVMAQAVGRLGAARASAATFIIPPVAVVLGVVVRNESVPGLAITGCTLCLLGAWIIQRGNTAPARAADVSSLSPATVPLVPLPISTRSTAAGINAPAPCLAVSGHGTSGVA